MNRRGNRTGFHLLQEPQTSCQKERHASFSFFLEEGLEMAEGRRDRAVIVKSLAIGSTRKTPSACQKTTQQQPTDVTGARGAVEKTQHLPWLSSKSRDKQGEKGSKAKEVKRDPQYTEREEIP